MPEDSNKMSNSNLDVDADTDEVELTPKSFAYCEQGSPSSKKKRRKALDTFFKYPCEWASCGFTGWGMNEFNHHVYRHRLEYTHCLGPDHKIRTSKYVFYCQWKDCNAEIEGQIDDFSRHVFYHTFHQYLKFVGQHIQGVDKLARCRLPPSSHNIVPELPEKLLCRWQDCETLYDNPYIFYSHVTNHCDDFPRGNKLGYLLKCKWEGCTTSVKSVYKMKEHIRAHTQEKVVACPTCGSLFASNTRFIDHLRRQIPSSDASFECSYCKQRFGSEKILRDHIRHHVNMYKCPLCDMTCLSPSAVRDHVRYRHSQERTFNCVLCSHRSKSQGDLTKHMKHHLNQAQGKQFSCTREGCSQVFSRRIKLMQHYSEDHKVSCKYECHHCSQRFTRGAVLTAHLQHKHHYQWPSGHIRFKYNLQEDGMRRLQTIRYESIEVSQQVLGQGLPPGSLPHQSETGDNLAKADGDVSYPDQPVTAAPEGNSGDLLQTAMTSCQIGMPIGEQAALEATSGDLLEAAMTICQVGQDSGQQLAVEPCDLSAETSQAYLLTDGSNCVLQYSDNYLDCPIIDTASNDCDMDQSKVSVSVTSFSHKVQTRSKTGAAKKSPVKFVSEAAINKKSPVKSVSKAAIKTKSPVKSVSKAGIKTKSPVKSVSNAAINKRRPVKSVSKTSSNKIADGESSPEPAHKRGRKRKTP